MVKQQYQRSHLVPWILPSITKFSKCSCLSEYSGRFSLYTWWSDDVLPLYLCIAALQQESDWSLSNAAQVTKQQRGAPQSKLVIAYSLDSTAFRNHSGCCIIASGSILGDYATSLGFLKHRRALALHFCLTISTGKIPKAWKVSSCSQRFWLYLCIDQYHYFRL